MFFVTIKFYHKKTATSIRKPQFFVWDFSYSPFSIPCAPCHCGDRRRSTVILSDL